MTLFEPGFNHMLWPMPRSDQLHHLTNFATMIQQFGHRSAKQAGLLNPSAAHAYIHIQTLQSTKDTECLACPAMHQPRQLYQVQIVLLCE